MESPAGFDVAPLVRYNGIMFHHHVLGATMTTATEAKAFTVRLPAELHDAASEAAARNGCSLNKLLQGPVQDYLRREEDKRRFDSFSRLVKT